MKVLQFSGGLDSLACLWLCQHQPDLVVLTVCTDGAYPEQHAYLNEVQAALPHVTFKRVHSERELAMCGIPVDVVPTKYTLLANAANGNAHPVRYQDAFDCCSRGYWRPMAKATAELNPDVIIRGQRDDDRLKAPIESGAKIDGVFYIFPIHDWSRQKVLDYCEAECRALIPMSYRLGEKTSRDCWDCTAYLADNAQRIKNLPGKKWFVVDQRLQQWRADVAAEMGELQ